jgi:subtilisin
MCFLFIFLLFPANALGNEEVRENYIMSFKESINEELTKEYEDLIYLYLTSIDAVAIELTEVEKIELLDHADVASIEVDEPIHVQNATIDWGVSRIGAPPVWSNGVTGQGVKVAVMDTGVDTSHPDLQVVKGKSFIRNQLSYNDLNGHGTHVAGIIGAQHNNFGVYGVAPDVDLYIAKVLDDQGNGFTSYVVEAIDWAVREGVDIINLSLGGKNQSADLQRAIDRAYSQGILFVAAAGNEGTQTGQTNTVDFPAAYSSVIAVAAVDNQDRRAIFSNGASATGPTVEVSAPGQAIRSTHIKQGYTVKSGTSMAAPHVAGHLALLKQAYPDKSHTQIRTLMQQQTKDLGPTGRDSVFGFGRIAIPSTLKITNPRPLEATGLQAIVEGWQNNQCQVKLSWTPPIDGEPPASYIIYRNNREIDRVQAGNQSYLDSVSPGTYTYSIETIGRNGEKSNRSKMITIKVEQDAEITPITSFNDVAGNEWFASALYDLKQRGIMTGYTDGSARPNQIITRGEAAVLMAKALNEQAVPYRSGFIDVRPQSFDANYIQAMVDRGIFSGYSTQIFRPHVAIPRGEVAAILSRGFNTPPIRDVSFYDVPTNYQFYQSVMRIGRANFASGYADGSFRPFAEVTRAEFATFLTRAIKANE